MANWHEIQRDFSGGEISQRMFMRDDLEVHNKSLQVMRNFMPSIQGTAIRTPGTRYLWEVAELGTRIFPYTTPDNQRTIIEMTPNDGTDGDIRIRQDIAEVIGDIPEDGSYDPDAPQRRFKQIVTNPNFNGDNGWTAVDPEYTVKGDTLGWEFRNPGSLVCTCRTGAGNAQDKDTCTLTATVTVPEESNKLEIWPIFEYRNNFTGIDTALHKISGVIKIGTTLGGSEVFSYDFSDFEISQRYDLQTVLTVADLPGGVPIPAATTLYLTWEVKALNDNGKGSTPFFRLQQWRVSSIVTTDVNTDSLTTVVPYTAEELDEVQFVQSPFNNSGDTTGTYGNEMVFVHPNHAPKRLYYNLGAYVFEDIPFVYRDGGGPATDITSQWTNGYPAAVTTYLGRLVLAGSNRDPILGGQTGSNTEKVWCTVVGKWNQFTDPNATIIRPDDSIQFTSTYRSPIQWVHGQQNLLVGSESFEYVSQADGIFSPGDIGVFLQSTHGSARVQPVPMGQYALFAAEQGSRVRAMQYVAESEYWISPDMTIYHPELFAKGGGIRRMVRMRNPHQMCVCVMGNGRLAVLHQDSYAGISGWSRMDLGNVIRDVCVQTKSDGTDVLYMLIDRNIEGETKQYLEAIVDWTYEEELNWNYNNSTVNIVPDTETNVFTGLGHLEGRIVQVVSNNSFIGSYQVSGGQITITTDAGTPINLSQATIGLAMNCRLRTMPLITVDPGAKKRYASLYVRCLNSSRPLINSKRPPDRDPIRVMGESQDLDIVMDYESTKLDWDRTQVLDIRENLPVRTEVIGIYGKVTGNTL